MAKPSIRDRLRKFWEEVQEAISDLLQPTPVPVPIPVPTRPEKTTR